jgi:hypothetical protein
MHELGRDYQPPFDNVKRCLRGLTLAFARRSGTNKPVQAASHAAFASPRNLHETEIGATFPTCATVRDRRDVRRTTGVRDPAPDSCSDERPLKHDGDPLPGSPSVIPQRTHGRVGRVLWEIGTTRTLKLPRRPKVATRDLQSQLPYLESPQGA